jgi:WD40 repeat protein
MSQDILEISSFASCDQKAYGFGVASQHWQLKDMLRVSGRSLVFPKECNVMSYDLSTCITSTIYAGMDFLPTAICVKNSMLAVGGAKGQLSIKNLATDETTSRVISTSINNNICIHDDKLFVCNNDRTLRILTMDLKNEQNIMHVAQVNSCAVSPDNKLLAVAGDSNDVFVYSLESEGCRLIMKLKSANDGGFSAAWNSSSSAFAVGTQDGYVCVWDIRGSGVLHRLESKQRDGHRGAVRNVKFSMKGSLDLLFFTEQLSYATICDTRDMRRIQRIKIFPDRQITGATFSENSEKIFVSTDDQVKCLNINTKSRRMFADA